MTDLIARLKQAEGPSRELDFQVAIASGEYTEPRGHKGMLAHKDTPHHVAAGWPKYTSSIDAALTLAEEGDAATILDEAMRLLGQSGWPGRWRDALPRFIAIAALKAKGGEG